VANVIYFPTLLDVLYCIIIVNVVKYLHGDSVEKKKLQIFISSTYLDLQDERQAAVEGILGSKHITAGICLGLEIHRN